MEGRPVSDSEGEDEGMEAGAVADAEAMARAEGATVERVQTGRAAGMHHMLQHALSQATDIRMRRPGRQSPCMQACCEAGAQA